jgi:hypothetical protein
MVKKELNQTWKRNYFLPPQHFARKEGFAAFEQEYLLAFWKQLRFQNGQIHTFQSAKRNSYVYGFSSEEIVQDLIKSINTKMAFFAWIQILSIKENLIPK